MMMDMQFDKSLWTSSFKKLLKTTEDDKTLRIINRIVKRALTGNKTDEEKIGQNEYKKLYNKEKYHVSKKNALINRNIKEKRSVRISLNGSLNNSPQIVDENLTELQTVNIYETVKLEKPKLINIYNENELNISKLPKSRKALNEVFDINYNKGGDYPSFNKNEREHSPENCDLVKAVDRISLNETRTISNCTGNISALEIIDAEVFDRTNEIPEYASPIKTSKNSTAEPIYATIDEDPSIDRLFFDTRGNILSPIQKCGQPQSKVEDRFVVNLYKNKCRPSDKPNANIVRKTNSANITPDKNSQQALKRRNQNRLVTRAIMDEFERLENVSLEEFAKELSVSAEKLEETESDLRYENYNSTYENCLNDCCTFTTQVTKIVENEKKQDANNNSNSGFFKLKQQADIECKIMRQASKALDLCRNRGNGIKDITVAVEAERILLTAACRYEKILREIRQDHYEHPIKFNNVGSVVIREIRADVHSNNMDEWYVCMLSNEENVFCTKPTQCESNSNELIFDDEFTFNNLDSNFEVKLEIFSLKIKRKKDDSHIWKNKRTLSRASRKLFYKDLQTHSLVESNIPISSFKSRGVIKVNVNNLMHVRHTIKLIEGSSLKQFAEITAHVAQVKIGEDRVGFLTVGTEGRTAINWNRRWCSLNGPLLKCWNYPNEEHSKKPVEVIDLSNCVQEIVKAKRSWCPRPKTLLIQMENDEKKYINADSVQDLYDWRNTLNRVYVTLYNWKMLQSQQGIYI